MEEESDPSHQVAGQPKQFLATRGYCDLQTVVVGFRIYHKLGDFMFYGVHNLLVNS